MEKGKLTINSILQALMLGCLGRAFVGKQSKDTFSFCHKYSLLKKTLPCDRDYKLKKYATRYTKIDCVC